MELLNKKQLYQRIPGLTRHYVEQYEKKYGPMPHMPGEGDGKRFVQESVERYLAEIEVREAILKRPSLEEEVNQLRKLFR